MYLTEKNKSKSKFAIKNGLEEKNFVIHHNMSGPTDVFVDNNGELTTVLAITRKSNFDIRNLNFKDVVKFLVDDISKEMSNKNHRNFSFYNIDTITSKSVEEDTIITNIRIRFGSW